MASSKKNNPARAGRKSKMEKLKRDLADAQEKQKKEQNETQKQENQKLVEELEANLSKMHNPGPMDVDDDKDEDGSDDDDAGLEKDVKKEDVSESDNDKKPTAQIKNDADQKETTKTEQKESAVDDHIPTAKQNSHDAADDKGAKAADSEDEEALFVATKQRTDDDDQDELDEDGEKALFVRHIPKHGDHIQTVGWGQGKTGTFYINRHGKRGASKYRLESLAESAEYEEREKNDEDPHKVTNSENRYGDKKLPNGKWKYTKRHIIGIWGVAWECPRGLWGGSRSDIVDKWPTTYVLIMWDIEGERKKVWETRSSLRSRWTKKGADAAIYEAACEAEDRHTEAETGMRPASSRSPSHGLAETATARFRAQSHHDESHARKVQFQVGKGAQDIHDVANALEAFKMSYGELYGKPFHQMNVKEKAEMVSSWQLQKAEILGY
ncbi:uncharacterized protein VDAG_02363 [Verticillium dahliae VdLs.17]|uniref:Uncharacterized protein n=1 Tax=Verticillium dahliae (strain VdLs.17 / ATCC MYA-4575 / FGSC 10137) TaxID=498257 RepID=G2WXN1_VERDV|nr:uncharacterized protein VDAG_02363 [Verticillium dahliae VdLs.17]EGY20839.1 hypothetical protein VDAG_02363 [Verticillium dahliae VdLs.17]